jgi:hypothetical protein
MAGSSVCRPCMCCYIHTYIHTFTHTPSQMSRSSMSLAAGLHAFCGAAGSIEQSGDMRANGGMGTGGTGQSANLMMSRGAFLHEGAGVGDRDALHTIEMKGSKSTLL